MARAATRAATAEASDSSDRMLQILTESARLFANNGYDGTSMRDIAEACGISKSLLYHHFTDKDALAAESGNLSRVALRLGISRPTLYRKLDQFGFRRSFV